MSIVDLPNPPHQKFYQTLAAALLGIVVMLLMAASSGHVWATGAVVVVVSFGSALLQSYGRQVLAVSFSMLFVMVIAIGSPVVPRADILEHTAFFALGALGYVGYSLAATWLLAFKTKQQALAESMFALAGYLRVRSRFYEPGVDLDGCYRDLIDAQMLVVEKQQAARELVLRRVQTMRDVGLVGMLLGALDVYERIFSSSTDYELLQEHFGGSDAMLFLRDIAEKGAEDLEEFACRVAGRHIVPKKISYKAERLALEYEMGRLGAAPQSTEAERHGLAVLRGVIDRMLHGINQIQELHSLSRTNLTRAQILGGQSLRPFLTTFSFSPGVLRRQLTARSPMLRFAVRLTAAMGCGYALAHILPYATHSYWILLTIAVVLRSSFSLTQQRRNDRIIGTVLGGMLTVIFLHFEPPSWAQMLVLFAALGTAHTFATIKYRYTAVAASVMALLQVHLLNPSTAFAVTERLVDTFVGGLLAFAFSFVWPSWERQTIPQQIEGLLRANRKYLDAILTEATADVEYRLARKQLFDAVAALTGSLRRMLNEPKSHHRAVRELNEFITVDYLLAAHAASVHLLLENSKDALEEAETHADLSRAQVVSGELLGQAVAAWRPEPGARPAPRTVEESNWDESLYAEVQWTPAMLLKRRLRLIQETAYKLASLSANIAAQW